MQESRIKGLKDGRLGDPDLRGLCFIHSVGGYLIEPSTSNMTCAYYLLTYSVKLLHPLSCVLFIRRKLTVQLRVLS